MRIFSNALVRKPCRSMVHGLSTAGLGPPDYEKALAQHAAYAEALRSCGLAVTELAAAEAFPDSVFIEDTAVLSEKAAVITRPGAPSRLGEEAAVRQALRPFYSRLEAIKAPGTLEGGDVFRAGDRFFVGISARTNLEGSRQLSVILANDGFTVIPVPLRFVLHLKTGVSYLENNRLLASGEFLAQSPKGTGAAAQPPKGTGAAALPQLSSFEIIPVPAAESYAANSLWINGRVLVPAGFPETLRLISGLGYETVPVDVSEFRKLDGGLSCLSLRW